MKMSLTGYDLRAGRRDPAVADEEDASGLDVEDESEGEMVRGGLDLDRNAEARSGPQAGLDWVFGHGRHRVDGEGEGGSWREEVFGLGFG